MSISAASETSPGRRILLCVAAVLGTIGSMYQIPLVNEVIWFKYLTTTSEIVISLVFLFLVRKNAGVWTAFGVAAVIVGARFLYGWGIANLQYDMDFIGSLQEGRFGLAAVILPLMYFFLAKSTYREIAFICAIWIGVVLAVDLAVYFFYGRSGVITVGLRGANRFVLSVVGPIVLIYILTLISFRQQRLPSYVLLIGILLLLVHVVLLTTSRAEALLLLGLLGFWVRARWPVAAFPMVVFALAATLVAGYVLTAVDFSNVAGRDYIRALTYAREAFPFGLGLVSEAIQKAQLGRSTSFFASDYGVILLMYRYGVVGVLLTAAMLWLWAVASSRLSKVPGGWAFAASCLIYIILIPVLDYGSANGATLIAALAVTVVGLGSGSRQRTMRTVSATRGLKLAY